MRSGLALVALVLTAAGCVSVPRPDERAEVIRRILASTVQLRSEREGGMHRVASGVIAAVDGEGRRAWIVTVRHFLTPSRPQQVSVQFHGGTAPVPAIVFALSAEDLDLDLAILEVEAAGGSPVRMREVAGLGDEVLIAAFPWGHRLTLVGGIVSQIASRDGVALVSGAARMVDAPVSYGSSGGGVFDARTGELVGIVETYRTTKIAIPELKDRTLEMPVPGETMIVPASVILHFARDFGLARRLPK